MHMYIIIITIIPVTIKTGLTKHSQTGNPFPTVCRSREGKQNIKGVQALNIQY